MLQGAGIRVALFIDPDPRADRGRGAIGAPVVELHTGAYAEATGARQATELERLRAGARLAAEPRPRGARGPRPELPQRAAGRGASARSSSSTSATPSSRAPCSIGLPQAVRDMKALMAAARA